ncbi:major capsid protein [Helicobacter sp. UBA3407]|uniref:major capsid protein n=1 Tax=Helicobacter TaxID=209 RepID=UPI002630E496|nr:major capsid protein [Helicobacter sp. UBA3407]
MSKVQESLSKFTQSTMQGIIKQTKATPSYLLDSLFKEQRGSIPKTIEVVIKKKDSFILNALSDEAQRQVVERDKEYILSLTLPRFAMRNTITPDEINNLKSFENTEGLTQALAQRIGEILSDCKNSYQTTLEYMAVGAIFGRIFDGEGKELFKLESTTSALSLESGKTLFESINALDDKFADVFGYVPNYKVLVSREFYDALHKKAKDEGLFQDTNPNARIENGVITLYGKTFQPYVAKYKNDKGKVLDFLSGKKGIAIPLDVPNVFKLFYARANHTQALNKAPELFFAAAPEELSGGQGYAIDTEMRAMPVCVQPDALIQVDFKN